MIYYMNAKHQKRQITRIGKETKKYEQSEKHAKIKDFSCIKWSDSELYQKSFLNVAAKIKNQWYQVIHKHLASIIL